MTTTTTAFCPSCGKQAAADDRYCRACGHALIDDLASGASADRDTAGADMAGEQHPPATGGRKRRGRTALLGLGLMLLAIAVAAAVVLFSGVLDDANDAPSATQRAAGERATMKPGFDQIMRSRDDLFKYERAYLNAYNAAREKITDYRREDRKVTEEQQRIDDEFADEFDACVRFTDVPCPDPTYPDPPKLPSFSTETKRIRAASTDLRELSAELKARTPSPALAGLQSQLLASVDALEEEASHNADVLDEAINPSEGEGVGSLDKGKLKTLRSDDALPAIRQLNRAADQIVTRLRLDRQAYDIPMGRDLDPNDHSNAL